MIVGVRNSAKRNSLKENISAKTAAAANAGMATGMTICNNAFSRVQPSTRAASSKLGGTFFK